MIDTGTKLSVEDSVSTSQVGLVEDVPVEPLLILDDINDDIRVDILDFWKSPRSKAVYPARWRLMIFPLSMELTITPTARP